MQRSLTTAVLCFPLILCSPSQAQSLPRVLINDSGVETSTIGPGAPAHVVGLQGHRQAIILDTGTQTYGMRYVVARDPKNPQAAIPGEGYIGMHEPADCNWYGGGFFDVQINGQSIGTTLIHSLCGRSSEGCGTVDFVFDAPQAVVRVRFVAKLRGDCLYAQVLLDPKDQIKSLRVVTRCYPSAFVTNGNRHVLTPTRDLRQGQRAELDVAKEWWTLYYDDVFDAGYITPGHTGVGPCAMLWVPDQTEKAGFAVGSYGTDTVLDFKPALRDLRFVFFDYAGKKNQEAKVNLQGRAEKLLAELAAFEFTYPGLAHWPLAEKHAEIKRALAALPEDKEAVARYEHWGQELAAQLKLLDSNSPGRIMAEANAAKTIDQWERGLPELKLKALLKEI